MQLECKLAFIVSNHGITIGGKPKQEVIWSDAKIDLSKAHVVRCSIKADVCGEGNAIVHMSGESFVTDQKYDYVSSLIDKK